jgi:hypothetical protein
MGRGQDSRLVPEPASDQLSLFKIENLVVWDSLEIIDYARVKFVE